LTGPDDGAHVIVGPGPPTLEAAERLARLRQGVERWVGGTVSKSRRLVLAVALLMLCVKVVVTVTTYGTNDIKHWTDFAAAVGKVGPIHIYGQPQAGSYYNHPPLMGYFLELVNFNRHIGIPLRVTIRGAASIADVATALIVFELVRRRRSLLDATLSGLLVAVSPVLFSVSAFHGNTDTIFTMLTLLSVYLLADRRAPLLSGAVIAIALGVKLVPVVAVPCLVVFAASRGRRSLMRFCTGFGLVLLITWGPAVALEWSSLRAQVLDYSGLGLGQWGLMQFGHWAGDPWWVAWMKGSGHLAIVAFCSALPAIAVWRRPDTIVTAVALSLSMFLALSPAFAVQYLAWAAAATCVLRLWGGILYNLAAGALLFKEYSRWSGAFPWTGKMAVYSPGTPKETVFAVLVWAILVCAVWRALVQIFSARRSFEVLQNASDVGNGHSIEQQDRDPVSLEVSGRRR
jgi:hypothetical protein